MEVLIQKPLGSSTGGPFAQLLLEPHQAVRAARMFERVLRESFEYDEKTMGKPFRERVQNGTEMKRRAQKMARWFRVFRADLGYSISRIEAELAQALRCELDGGIYTPAPSRGSYGVPEGDTQ